MGPGFILPFEMDSGLYFLWGKIQFLTLFFLCSSGSGLTNRHIGIGLCFKGVTVTILLMISLWLQYFGSILKII
jgi:hypothetical protein